MRLDSMMDETRSVRRQLAEMLARVRDISMDPEREAVPLVGHGSGTDASNQRWLNNLASITRQMRERGAEFAEIHWANWQEDWPQHRETAEAEIHRFVAEQRELGRTVLVVPARMAQNGPERDAFETAVGVRLGTGFAPHPLFGRWIAEQLEDGRRALTNAVEWTSDR